jgi:cytoskeletal protein CcmA (bactofilin family)
MKWRTLCLGLLVCLLLMPAIAAFADGPIPGSDGERIFWDEDVSLQPGETVNGDLAVFRGDLDLPEGSAVNGDVFVTGGHATIAGRVNGNVAVVGGALDLAESGSVRGEVFATAGPHTMAGQVGGNVSILFGDLGLRSTALLAGDLLVVPGHLERDEGSRVRGHVVTEETLSSRTRSEPLEGETRLPRPTRVPPPSPPSELPGVGLAHAFGRILGTLFLFLVFVAVCALVVLVWPRPTQRVADCIAALPAQSLGLGLITFLIAAGLEVVAVVAMVLIILVGALLMATVILIPLGLLLILLSWLVLLPVPLAMAGGIVLAWAGLAEMIGRKVLAAFGARTVSPLGAAFVGLLITGSIAAVLWIVKPLCCAWPFVILLTALGLGSVFHTRFGRLGCRAGGRPPAAPSLPADAMDQEDGQPDVPQVTSP